jgi:hypothetical protein
MATSKQAGAKAPAPKRTRGRPATRQREAFMVAIWVAVMEEIHKRNPPGKHRPMKVLPACVRICERGGIRIVDQAGTTIDRVVSPGTLRKRFEEADKARHDSVQFPSLHARAARLEQTLPGTFERMRAARIRHQGLTNRGVPVLEWDLPG